MATIAIVHIGLAGHVGPASRLGGVLARGGHRVLAWAPEACRDQVESTGAEFRPSEPAAVRWFTGGLPGFAAQLTDGTRREVGEVIEGLLAEQVDLVVHDCHALWGKVAADFLGLPRIVSNPLFPAGPLKASDGQLEALFPSGWPDAVKRTEDDRIAIGREWGIDIGSWYAAMVSDGEATVSYTTAEIVGRPELRPGWEYVGPLMEARVSPAPADPPLVYVAMGTFSNFRPDVYEMAIDALAGEAVEVIVSTGRGLISPAALEPLPANTKAFDFVDSREVLARARAHVTHGGGGSVHESLLAGVPMACVPQAVDQFLWAERMERLGASETVELTSAAIRAAVRRLLEDDRPRAHAQALGERLARYDGAARVMQLVDRALSASSAVSAS